MQSELQKTQQLAQSDYDANLYIEELDSNQIYKEEKNNNLVEIKLKQKKSKITKKQSNKKQKLKLKRNYPISNKQK